MGGELDSAIEHAVSLEGKLLKVPAPSPSQEGPACGPGPRSLRPGIRPLSLSRGGPGPPGLVLRRPGGGPGPAAAAATSSLVTVVSS